MIYILIKMSCLYKVSIVFRASFRTSVPGNCSPLRPNPAGRPSPVSL